MYLFNTCENKANATVVADILDNLGLKYISGTEEMPTLFLISKDHPNSVFGQTLNPVGLKHFLKNVPAGSRVYTGDDELVPFLNDVLALFNPTSTDDQRSEQIYEAALKTSMLMLSLAIKTISEGAGPMPESADLDLLAVLFGQRPTASEEPPVVPKTPVVPQPLPFTPGWSKPTVIAKPKRTAAGFNKTKASPLATKSVKVGKLPLARKHHK